MRVTRRTESVGERFARFQNVGPGFDSLRVFLAFSVVLNHSFLIVEGNYDTVERYGLWTFFSPAIPMFFALSGFLVARSAMRLTLKHFVFNRIVRIIPPLTGAILFSTLVIGVLFTTMPLGDYFLQRRFFTYFTNLVGFTHYQLPGVFLDNPFADQVNGSLWTIAYDMGCYAIMACMMVLGILKSPRRMVLWLCGFVGIYYGLYWYLTPLPSFVSLLPTEVFNYLNSFLSPRGNHFYFYFLAGALFYILRDRIAYRGIFAVAALVLMSLHWSGLLHLGMLTPLILAAPVAYFTIYVGLLTLPKLPLYSRGDYSYGIYLYAYPLQQALVAIYPHWHIALHFLCSIIIATLFAIASWHFVEKPTLSWRKRALRQAREGGKWGEQRGSNPQPSVPQTDALTN